MPRQKGGRHAGLVCHGSLSGLNSGCRLPLFRPGLALPDLGWALGERHSTESRWLSRERCGRGWLGRPETRSLPHAKSSNTSLLGPHARLQHRIVRRDTEIGAGFPVTSHSVRPGPAAWRGRGWRGRRRVSKHFLGLGPMFRTTMLLA